MIYCSHGYGPAEIPAHHRAAVESVTDPIAAIGDVIDAAYGDRDGRNIVRPLREPNGTLRTEWERLKEAHAQHADDAHLLTPEAMGEASIVNHRLQRMGEGYFG